MHSPFISTISRWGLSSHLAVSHEDKLRRRRLHKETRRARTEEVFPFLVCLIKIPIKRHFSEEAVFDLDSSTQGANAAVPPVSSHGTLNLGLFLSFSSWWSFKSVLCGAIISCFCAVAHCPNTLSPNKPEKKIPSLSKPFQTVTVS